MLAGVVILGGLPVAHAVEHDDSRPETDRAKFEDKLLKKLDAVVIVAIVALVLAGVRHIYDIIMDQVKLARARDRELRKEREEQNEWLRGETDRLDRKRNAALAGDGVRRRVTDN